MKILVVDDDRLIRAILKDLLDSSDYEVFMAKDVAEGLEILNKEKIKAKETEFKCIYI